MTEAEQRFAGSGPELYDRYLGPVIFEPYAADLTRRVILHSDDPVLETACGTGILTRHLRARMPAGARLIATDLSKSMLDYAREKLGSVPHIDWQLADAAALPFPAASFSVVVSQFGLMFVPDKKAAIRECRRVLIEGGLVALNVWDSPAHNPFARIADDTIASFFPTEPNFYKEGPFGFHDPKALRELLDASGFTQVQIERVTLEARSPSAESFAVGLVNGSPMIRAVRDRGGSPDRIVAAVAEALSRLGGDRPFRSTMQAFVATARAVGL